MYNIRLESYVPQPMPATTDRIVAAHYYAAWKKGAPGLHEGFNDLHSFPERTPLMGYYDEENPAVCDWEIKWATEHGILLYPLLVPQKRKHGQAHHRLRSALRPRPPRSAVQRSVWKSDAICHHV